MCISICGGISIKGDPCMILRLDCMVLIYFTLILFVTNSLSQISTPTIRYFFLTPFRYSTNLNMLPGLISFLHYIHPRIISTRTPIHKAHLFQTSMVLPHRRPLLSFFFFLSVLFCWVLFVVVFFIREGLVSQHEW